MITLGSSSRKETGMTAPTSVEDYLAGLPDQRRAAAEELRQTIKAAAPEATETIAYQMPAYRSHGGQFLVSYAAFKNHYSLFPASQAVIEALGEALKPYLSGKGTIRFPADKPIPAALVTKIVKVRVEETAARERHEVSRDEIGDTIRVETADPRTRDRLTIGGA
jgi:uncharacterized protein YdhG (YjbR/CyaY superfamily)